MSIEGMIGVAIAIAQLFAIVGGGFWVVSRNEHKVQTLIEKIMKIEIKLEEFTTALIQIARQEERMNAMDTRLQEISNRVSNCITSITPKIKRQ